MDKTVFELNNVAIEKIYRSTSGKNGKPFVSMKGNAYTKVDVYINEGMIDDVDFKGKMSYFDYYDNTKDWNVGTMISGQVEKNGVYFNFQLPPTGKKAFDLELDKTKQTIIRMQKDIEDLKAEVFGNKGEKEQEESPEDSLPF